MINIVDDSMEITEMYFKWHELQGVIPLQKLRAFLLPNSRETNVKRNLVNYCEICCWQRHFGNYSGY